MTNTKLLKEVIGAKGMKMNFIAGKLNISRTALWRKVNNKSPFNQYEIADMCKILGINNWKDRTAIFFAENVD